MIQFLKSFWLELLITILVFFVFETDLTFLIFYSLVLVLMTINYQVNHLRKMIRIYQFSNEVKIVAIMRKLGVEKEMLEKITEEVKNDTPEKDWKNLEKDFKSMINN